MARGRLAAGQRPISEATRLDVVAALLRFREAADESEFAFPPGLSNDDRALVHQECRKYGFTSKSHGKGAGEGKGLLVVASSPCVLHVPSSLR